MQAALEQPMVNLRTYTGEAVKMLGSNTVKVKYGEQRTHLTVYVVDGKGPNLLGRDYFSQLANILTLVAPTEVLENIVLLFKEGLGILEDVTVKLQVNQSVPLKFFKARSIPFTLKGKVEAELESIQAFHLLVAQTGLHP